MRHARSIIPSNSLATVPEVYLFDSDASVIIMEDCAATSASDSDWDTYTLTLKEYLLRTEGTRPSPPNELISRQIGVVLGEFIATLHGKSKTDEEVLDRFDKNQQARALSAWATYGRLRSTLSGVDALPALAESPFEISEDELKKIDVIAEKAQALIRTSREALVHGDFWPGNVLVRFKPTSEGSDEVDRICLVDWELVKPGSRGVELGQFLGELHQASRFCEKDAKSAEAVKIGLLEAYRQTAESEEGDVKWEKVASEAVVHVGAHLVTWTPRAWTWAEKERIRSVVNDGVRFLLTGEDVGLLEQSPVGVLLASSTS